MTTKEQTREEIPMPENIALFLTGSLMEGMKRRLLEEPGVKGFWFINKTHIIPLLMVVDTGEESPEAWIARMTEKYGLYGTITLLKRKPNNKF